MANFLFLSCFIKGTPESALQGWLDLSGEHLFLVGGCTKMCSMLPLKHEVLYTQWRMCQLHCSVLWFIVKQEIWKHVVKGPLGVLLFFYLTFTKYFKGVYYCDFSLGWQAAVFKLYTLKFNMKVIIWVTVIWKEWATVLETF